MYDVMSNGSSFLHHIYDLLVCHRLTGWADFWTGGCPCLTICCGLFMEVWIFQK